MADTSAVELEEAVVTVQYAADHPSEPWKMVDQAFLGLAVAFETIGVHYSIECDGETLVPACDVVRSQRTDQYWSDAANTFGWEFDGTVAKTLTVPTSKLIVP